MTDYIKLRADNAGITVNAPIYLVEETAKKVLGWRGPTKRFDTVLDRYKETGSSNYDKVIRALHIMGY